MFDQESTLMKFFRKFGLESIAWSLRRLHCPVPTEALVLEVGSGGNPYYRSNVLLDAYEVTRQRHFEPLIKDRPTVLGFVESLPFKDKAFDFVIACHVLEHSADPGKFLTELERVASSGYIETPDAFMERMNPYLDHRSEITLRNETLVIRKKKRWQLDPELVELYCDRANKVIAGKSIPSHPFEFHVRYYWVGNIKYQILNPDDDSDWEAETQVGQIGENFSIKQKCRSLLLKSLRSILSQNKRNRKIDLMTLLACPNCRSENLNRNREYLECSECSMRFLLNNGTPNMCVKTPTV